MATSHRKSKAEVLREQVEAGIHPMQESDLKKRKKSAEQIAEKMIAQALAMPQKNQ